MKSKRKKNNQSQTESPKIKPLLVTVFSSGFFLFFCIFPINVNFATSTTQEIINNLRITATVSETRPENLIDTDNDGIPNIWEIFYNLDPENPFDASLDPDQDTLNNLQEYNYNTNPRLFDTNEGGIYDNIQIQDKTCPYKTGNDYQLLTIDSDSDSLPDWWEKLYSFDPYSINDTLDLDGDGLTNNDEYIHGTNPTQKDTDKDGLWDGAEAYITKTSPVNQDSDFDNLNDYEEFVKYGTDPNIVDTDKDKLSDGDEILNGTDPLDSNSRIELPNIRVILEEETISKKDNQFKILISDEFKVKASINNIDIPTKLNFQNSVFNNTDFIETPNVDTYIPAILTYYTSTNEVLGKTYLNFNIQQPLTVFKHRQYVNLFNIKLSLNDIFYSNLSQILGLNKIYPLKEVTVKISSDNLLQTDENGKVNIILPEKEYSVSYAKKGFSPLSQNEQGPVINPIVKLDKIYDLTLYLIIIITLVLIRTIYIRRKNKLKK